MVDLCFKAKSINFSKLTLHSYFGWHSLISKLLGHFFICDTIENFYLLTQISINYIFRFQFFWYFCRGEIEMGLVLQRHLHHFVSKQPLKNTKNFNIFYDLIS